MDALTFRSTQVINKKLSIQGYLELFSNYDIFNSSTYSKLITSNNTYSDEYPGLESHKYIIGGWFDNEIRMDSLYSKDMDKVENEKSYLDPNLYNEFYTKYTSIIFNGILKWNYVKGSNIYFIYSWNKHVNGMTFDRTLDFLKFNSKELWTEVLRDQTFMIKIDYWFEK